MKNPSIFKSITQSNWYNKSNEIQTPSFISSSSGLEIIEKDETFIFCFNENIIGEPFYLEDFDKTKYF